MIFKLHYFLMAAGANALNILLGVFIAEYTDATPTEIGFLYMILPFVGIFSRPLICSLADRQAAHQRLLITCLLVTAVSYAPFVVVPFIGPKLYSAYPRLCWYLLLVFKVFGDIAFGSAISIGDSLAINYAHRIGTNFSVYRIWATISWMLFGLIIGQINEVWFLPKYVPAFLILISASLLNSFIIWLWPAEYFMMVPIRDESMRSQCEKEQLGEPKKKVNVLTKSLMPKEIVWAHAKGKLLSLLRRSRLEPAQARDAAGAHEVVQSEAEKKVEAEQQIDRRLQVKMLLLLLRRDPRILLYGVMFIAAGAVIMPIPFFYLSLSGICKTNNKCDFSQLGGLIQVSMSSTETIIFLYIKQIIEFFGRLNSVSLAFLIAAAKYTFYGTIWPSVDPYFSLLTEMSHGMIYCVYLTLMVELAHLFSNEIELLIPELIERGVLESDNASSNAKLKLSLSATMQALMSAMNDGLGRGFGALIYGSVLEHYSYDILWISIGIGSFVVFTIVQLTNLIDHCLDLRLGLDTKYKAELERRVRGKQPARMESEACSVGSRITTVAAQVQTSADTISSTSSKQVAINDSRAPASVVACTS